MQDNVRRGGELVGGQGGAAPDFTFATLYRLRQWQDGALHFVYKMAGGPCQPTFNFRDILTGRHASVNPDEKLTKIG